MKLSLSYNRKAAIVSRRLLEMAALEGYRSGELTAFQVQQMLGLASRVEVDGFLKAHGIAQDYTAEDLRRDQAAVNALLD